MELDKAILKSITEVIKKPYELGEIPLHEPFFESTNALKYVSECIDSGFVSSIGKWGSLFEDKICDFTGAKNAILVTNGTVGLRLGLHLAGVKIDNEVLIPPISFVASANAVSHLGACPHFIDINEEKPFVDSIAILKNVDLLITIDSAIVHLAGVLNVPSILLLGKVSDWRWFDNNDKIWYNSVDILHNKNENIYDNIPLLIKKIKNKFTILK